MKVVTPIPIILLAFFNGLKERYSGLTVQFDPTLDFIETIKGVRLTRSAKGILNPQIFPLLSYARQKIVPQVDLSRMVFPVINRDMDTQKPTADKYLGRRCSFELGMRFYESDAVMFDTFEALYSVKESINRLRTFTVSLPEVGDITYQVMWGDMEDVDYSSEDNFYISGSLTCNIQGPLLVSEEVSEKLIYEIQARIQTFREEILAEFGVTA